MPKPKPKAHTIESCILCTFRYAYEKGTQSPATNCPCCGSSITAEEQTITADVAKMLQRRPAD